MMLFVVLTMHFTSCVCLYSNINNHGLYILFGNECVTTTLLSVYYNTINYIYFCLVSRDGNYNVCLGRRYSSIPILSRRYFLHSYVSTNSSVVLNVLLALSEQTSNVSGYIGNKRHSVFCNTLYAF